MNPTGWFRSPRRSAQLPWRGPAFALVAVLLVAGCGSGGVGEPASEPTASSTESERAVTSSVTEPADTSTESERAAGAESGTATDPEAATDPGAATESEPAGESATQPDAADEEMVITIVDFAFEVPDSIPVGAEITVVNEDPVGHTVTSDEGRFDLAVGPGEQVSFTVPDQAGEFPFHCSPHPSMTSALVIG